MIKKQVIKLGQPFNLNWFSEKSSEKGFVVLHSGEGGVEDECWTIVGQCPRGKESEGTIRKSRLQVGYFAYPNPTLKNKIPNQLFYEFNSLFFYNHQTEEAFVRYEDGANLEKWNDVFPEGANIYSRLQETKYKTHGKLHQSVTKSEYIKKIHQIKELLAAGEVYQINYAIRFQKKLEGGPYALFLKLSETNPVDFSAYLNCGDFQIISSSPERFFKVENGKIITQPIKGTARKSANVETRLIASNPNMTDPNLIELLNSEKERAELDMITDLERNDVGKICKYGTLKLNKERAVLELKNIWHTYSEVEGQLESGIGLKKMVDAMLPSGSITGCPKKRAMEYIEKLEGMPRNIYTGSIGYMFSEAHHSSLITPNSLMDFNIAIRTILIKDGMLEFWAGGGIVADSDPESEYNECMLKAEKFLNLI